MVTPFQFLVGGVTYAISTNKMEFSKSGVNLSVCAYCTCTLTPENRTVDHLDPKSRGGKLSNKNKLPACRKCNELKDNLNLDEFEKTVERLIHYETIEHRVKKGYLIRVKHNIQKIKDGIGRNTKG